MAKLMKNLYKQQKSLLNKADMGFQKMPKAYNLNKDLNYQQAGSLIGKYADRKPFTYDINRDALYDQYKNQYIKQGQKAMRDTIGELNARNGGYGSSYAQAVGQQQYQEYLDNLNGVIPELYNAAYNRYQDDGNNMLNAANAYHNMSNLGLNAYNTNFNAWATGQGMLENRLGNAQGNYLNQLNANRDFKFNKKTDNRNFKYQKGQDAIQNDQAQQQIDIQKQNAAASMLRAMSGGGSKSGRSGEAVKADSKKGSTIKRTAKTFGKSKTPLYKDDKGNWYERNGYQYIPVSDGLLKKAGIKTTGYHNVELAVRNHLLNIKGQNYFRDPTAEDIYKTVRKYEKRYGKKLTSQQVKEICHSFGQK